MRRGALVVACVLAIGGRAYADRVDDNIRLLGRADATVRRVAVIMLVHLGDRRAIPPLVVALRDSDSKVRSSAAFALGVLIDATVPAVERDPAIDALFRMATTDGDRDAQAEAIKVYQTLLQFRLTRGRAAAKLRVIHDEQPAATVTSDELTIARDQIGALSLGLGDCDAQSLANWMRFPVTVKKTTYANAKALVTACRAGKLPAFGEDAAIELDLHGRLHVTVGGAEWRFAFHESQWWLVSVE
jgi:hypothetical protein